MKLAGVDEIQGATEDLLALAGEGIVGNGDLARHLGLDIDALRQLSTEAAEEEFMVLPGLPSGVPSEGRLRNLSANQRAAVKEALRETYVIALETGVQLERKRGAR